MKPNVTVILGPTASGKTDYGIQLARTTNGAVISADSRQVYTGMDIGTAKPDKLWGSQTTHDVLTPDVVGGIDHYLFNVRTPDTPLSLADWQTMANSVLEHIIAQGKHPIIVGGTMLYIDSIVKNYQIPAVPPNTVLREELEQLDTATLYGQLQSEDPDATQYMDSNNKRRIIRALEVMRATGKPFSDLRKQRPSPYTFALTGIFPGWEVLSERIIKRHTAMFAGGLLEETRKLCSIYTETLPLLKTMNYVQAMDVLAHRVSQEAALEENIKINLRYARRQLSWWRGRTEISWTDASP